jgi:hypothetical protein
MLFKYSSNNSGGSWWISDEGWKALEAAGWTVNWCVDEKHLGQRKGTERWLSALATSAEKELGSLQDAITELEFATGANFSDEGCNCCGPPHNMFYTDEEGAHHYVDCYDFRNNTRVNPWD